MALGGPRRLPQHPTFVTTMRNEEPSTSPGPCLISRTSWAMSAENAPKRPRIAVPSLSEARQRMSKISSSAPTAYGLQQDRGEPPRSTPTPGQTQHRSTLPPHASPPITSVHASSRPTAAVSAQGSHQSAPVAMARNTYAQTRCPTSAICALDPHLLATALTSVSHSLRPLAGVRAAVTTCIGRPR